MRYKENSTNCYFSIYLLGWETLIHYKQEEEIPPAEKEIQRHRKEKGQY